MNKITPAAIVYHDNPFPVTWRVLPRSLHAVINTGSGFMAEWRPYTATFGELYLSIRDMLQAGAGAVEVDDETIETIFADMKPVNPPREKKPVDLTKTPWAGERISGKGFWIDFDSEQGKTLIHFEKKPTSAALDLLHAEKWFYRRDLRAWSKKLSVKAYRAAVKFALAMGAVIPDDLPIPDMT